MAVPVGAALFEPHTEHVHAVGILAPAITMAG